MAVASQALTGCATLSHIKASVFTPEGAQALGEDFISTGNPVMAAIGTTIVGAAAIIKSKRKVAQVMEAKREKRRLLELETREPASFAPQQPPPEGTLPS